MSSRELTSRIILITAITMLSMHLDNRVLALIALSWFIVTVLRLLINGLSRHS